MEDTKSKFNASPLLTFFRSGAWETKKPRYDGFLLTDLRVFNEDPTPREEEDDNRMTPLRDSSRYGEQRALARQVLNRVRYHLADTADVHVRHLAHVCVHHSMIILSTRIDDLLPAIHAVWECLLDSLSPTTSERIRLATLHVLRVLFRFSGEFLHGRLKDLLPSPLLSSGGTPMWRGKVLDLLSFWAQDDEFLSQKIIPHVLRYAAGELAVSENRVRAEGLLEFIGPRNPGMLFAVIPPAGHEGHEVHVLDCIPRKPRIPLTAWTDVNALLKAVGA